MLIKRGESDLPKASGGHAMTVADTVEPASTWRWWPHRIALVILAVVWVAFLAVDLVWQGSPNDWPLWFLFFREGGIVEHLTWLMLAAASLLAMFTAGRAWGRAPYEFQRFWLILAIGIVLLLIEDAGDTSHRFAYYLGVVFGEVRLDAARLPVYVVLGGVMLYALLRYRRIWRDVPGVARPLLGGYVLYAIGAGLSVPFNLFTGGYDTVGLVVLEGWFGGALAGLPEPIWGATADNSHVVFMDLAIEESVELLAASLLATASLRAARRSAETVQQDPVVQASHSRE